MSESRVTASDSVDMAGDWWLARPYPPLRSRWHPFVSALRHGRPRPFARPAYATRLQQDRVHLVTLGQSVVEVVLFTGGGFSLLPRHQIRVGKRLVWNICISDPVDAIGQSTIRLHELFDC
jgi:hypothetical protein